MIKRSISQTQEDGGYASFKRVWREKDTDRNGHIGFDELAAPTHIEQHCRRAKKVQASYICDEPMTHDTQGLMMAGMQLQDELNNALNEYGAYRRNGNPPPPMAGMLGGLAVGQANRVLREEGLPTLDPRLVRDAMEYSEAHMDEFRAQNIMPMPAPSALRRR